jgi:hypothetical protein
MVPCQIAHRVDAGVVMPNLGHPRLCLTVAGLFCVNGSGTLTGPGTGLMSCHVEIADISHGLMQLAYMGSAALFVRLNV